jgi:hypothetical protein
LKQCPEQCDTITYDLSLSTYSYPSTSFAKKLFDTNFKNVTTKLKKLNFTSFEDLKNTLIDIRVYYPDLAYQTITQSPIYAGIDLLSLIGGTLSLFIGFSILSFVEIMDLFLSFFIILIRKKHIHLSQIEPFNT